MVQMNFDSTQHDPSTGGSDIFETGEYLFQITQSEVKQTKKGDGHMLVLTATCMDEAAKGRRLPIRLNVHNPNPVAVEIAQRDLSAISHVVGVLRWSDTQELHGRPFRVRVEKVQRNDDPTKFGNEIRGYLDANGNPPGQGQQNGAAPAQPSAPQPPAAAQQQPAPAPEPAPAPQPQPAPAPEPAPQPAPAPAPDQGAAAAPPWQQAAAPAPAPAAGGATPPWQR